MLTMYQKNQKQKQNWKNASQTTAHWALISLIYKESLQNNEKKINTLIGKSDK